VVTRRVFASSVAASAAAVFIRTPLASRIVMTEPLASGVSLKVMRTSDGDFVSRVSEAGFDFT
jgi:hypothetical protein